jgi:hypothetical protein
LICLSYINIRIDINPFTPPFTYNYLCTSTLLSAYIPIYFYIFLSEDLLLLVSTSLLTLVDSQKIPLWLKSSLDGIHWPSHWIEMSFLHSKTTLSQSFTNVIHTSHRPRTGTTDSIVSDGSTEEQFSFDSKTRKEFFNAESLINKQAQDLLLFLTFGLTCPVLGVLILASIALRIVRDQIVIGRYLFSCEQFYLSREQGARERERYPVTLLKESLGHIGRAYHYRLWVIVWSSCLFYSFLCWDIAGDEVGFLRSVWVPFVCLGYVVLVRVIVRYQRWQDSKKEIKIPAPDRATLQLGIEFAAF